jgi:stage II sporulation protein AA (anti-sigma F factor antagonist)
VSDESIVTIATSRLEGIDVVAVGGEVDLTNADDIERALVATSAVGVVLDLTEVTYLDSSGLRAIDRAHRHLVREQRTLRVVAPPETASDWTLRVAGLDRAIVLDSLDAARGAATPAPAGS